MVFGSSDVALGLSYCAVISQTTSRVKPYLEKEEAGDKGDRVKEAQCHALDLTEGYKSRHRCLVHVTHHQCKIRFQN